MLPGAPQAVLSQVQLGPANPFAHVSHNGPSNPYFEFEKKKFLNIFQKFSDNIIYLFTIAFVVCT